MDIRTWQDADRADDPRDAGSYHARHRSRRSPFSPLRPAPIAIGGMTTAAFAAVALVGPGGLHFTGSAADHSRVEGLGPQIGPLVPGAGAGAGAAVAGGTNAGSGVGAGAQAPGQPAGSTAPGALSPTAVVATSARIALKAPVTSPRPSSSPTSTPVPPQPTQSQPPSTPPSTAPTSTNPPPPTSTPPVPPPTSPTVVTPTVPPPTTPTTPTTPPPPTFNAAAAESSALSQITTARRHQGTAPLVVNHALSTAAAVHTTDMVKHHIFSHTGSDGSDPSWRAWEAGCTTFSKEIIARGNPGDDIIGAILRDPQAGQALTSYWNQTIGVSAQLDPKTGQVVWTIELGWM